MGVIPNPKMAFIFPISCILALIFPILIKYFPKCVGKGRFLKSQIKSLVYKKVSKTHMFNTMTSQFYEWVRSSMKKHAVTIGCFTCHMSHANSADFNM